jgi:signal transduction histidine kinase
MSEPDTNFENAPSVPMPRLVGFVKQVAHDVRNGLNAIDLQAAFIAEIAGEAEVAEEIGKLRKIVSHVARDMQQLSSYFGEIRPVVIAYPIEEFLQGLRESVAEEFENQAKRIVWETKTGQEEVEIDFALVTKALMELIRNAINFREGDQAIRFIAAIDDQFVSFELRQARSQPVANADQWGAEPLASSRRGGYGLGLFYVRRILDKLGGRLEPRYDVKSGELSVRLTLPVKARNI